MTGPQLKQLYKSIGWTGKQTAEALEIDPVTLSAIVGRDKVDKRTELAMRFLWQIESENLRRIINGDYIPFPTYSTEED